MPQISLTDEQLNNFLALLNRVQVTGLEAEVVVQLKQILSLAISQREDGMVKEKE